MSDPAKRDTLCKIHMENLSMGDDGWPKILNFLWKSFANCNVKIQSLLKILSLFNILSWGIKTIRHKRPRKAVVADKIN